MSGLGLDSSQTKRTLALARGALGEILDGSIADSSTLDAQLAAAELVTNSIRHVGGPGTIYLRDDLSGERLRVEIGDDSAGFDHVVTARNRVK